MAKEIKEKKEDVDQINQILKANTKKHFNFGGSQNTKKLSSRSLMMDIELGGGVGPGIVRLSGPSESGKTHNSLAFAKSFQEQFPEDGIVVYFKAEGRLDDMVLERCGIDTSPNRWRLIKSNLYEFVCTIIHSLVYKNEKNLKYFFIIDSGDALIPENDAEKSFYETAKVAGGAVLCTDFCRRLSLALNEFGHYCFWISQVRSAPKIDPYAKTEPRITNGSTVNALQHYPNWVFEFQSRYKSDLILGQERGKEVPIGHWCKLVFKKSPNEKTNRTVTYPIKYGRKGGRSIWIEKEVVSLLIQWEMIEVKKAGWSSFAPSLKTEMETALKCEVPETIQGEDNIFEYLQENPKVNDFLLEKIRNTLT
jgi:hypothetical protein